MNPDEQRALAVTFYNAERAEVIQRLGMREQVLLASLTVSGVIAGLAYNGTARPQLLILLPLFALPFALAHVRHTEVIKWLGEYLCHELNSFLDPSCQIRHWDESKTLENRITNYLRKEIFMHIFLICGPGLIAAIYLQFFNPGPGLGWVKATAIWVFISLAMLIMASPLCDRHTFRSPINN
jgi:hypothetical protein